MVTEKLMFISLLIILILFLAGCRNYDNIRHKLFRRQARRVYKKLNSINNDNELWMLSYLRKINPFVFEELVLYAFKKKGCKVYYNKRYTGDGGIDGKVKVNGKVCLIQDKRYTGYVNKEHIKVFNELCINKNTSGYFIHTGKTGEGIQAVQSEYPAVTIISGKNLIALVQGTYIVS